jgi:hypothetical protein
MGGARSARPEARPGAVRRTAANKPEPGGFGWRAERRRASLAGGAPVTARFSARHPLVLRGTEKAYGVPGAAKNTGGGALACRAEASRPPKRISAKAEAKAGCLINESEMHKRRTPPAACGGTLPASGEGKKKLAGRTRQTRRPLAPLPAGRTPRDPRRCGGPEHSAGHCHRAFPRGESKPSPARLDQPRGRSQTTTPML